MFTIRYATNTDKAFWYSLEQHMSESEYEYKTHEKRCYIIGDGQKPVGIMRYNLFWDNTPFLTLIYLDELWRGKGYGKKAMIHWEEEMVQMGYKMVMTSTQADEDAQHFYRKLGYKDSGCLMFIDEPLEIILVKSF